MSNQLS